MTSVCADNVYGNVLGVNNKDEITYSSKELDDLNELLEYGIILKNEYDRQLDILLNPQPLQTEKLSETNEESENQPPENNLFEDIEFDAQGNEMYVQYIYHTNPEGKQTLTVRKIQKQLVSKTILTRVLNRRNIQKFGQCAGLPPGPEPGITSLGDYVWLEPPSQSENVSKIVTTSVTSNANVPEKTMSVTCRNCLQPGHWTKDCKLAKNQNENSPSISRNYVENDVDVTKKQCALHFILGCGSCFGSKSGNQNSGRYVPPSLRDGQQTNGNQSNEVQQTESPNVRIGNLDEDATENDLRNLFERFGDIKRVNIVKDKKTGESRGFAYLEFYDAVSAEKAVAQVNGHPYGNQILSVSISQPRERENNNSYSQSRQRDNSRAQRDNSRPPRDNSRPPRQYDQQTYSDNESQPWQRQQFQPSEPPHRSQQPSSYDNIKII